MGKRIVVAGEADRRDWATQADFAALKADFSEFKVDFAKLETEFAAAIGKGPDGCIPRPGRIDCSLIGTLHGKIAPGTPPFDLQKFREQPRDPSLRD